MWSEWYDFFTTECMPVPEPTQSSSNTSEPEPTRSCKRCKQQLPQHQFPSITQFNKKNGGVCTACTCVYCGGNGQAMTKEHLLPKSVGGTVIVPACHDCNQARGRSGSYKPFIRYIKKNNAVWAKAVTTATKPNASVAEYIEGEDGLSKITLLALMQSNS